MVHYLFLTSKEKKSHSRRGLADEIVAATGAGAFGTGACCTSQEPPRAPVSASAQQQMLPTLVPTHESRLANSTTGSGARASAVTIGAVPVDQLTIHGRYV